MPLSEFFADQFRQIREFMLDPGEVVRVIHVDPDLEPILLKALARMDDEPDNPHAMLYADAPFENPEQWFIALLEQLEADHAKHAAALETNGCSYGPPAEDPTQHPAQRFCLYASALADALPDSLGSLVFLVHPPSVTDAAVFRQCVAWLAREVRSRWLKFIVLDARLNARLEGVDIEEEQAGAQTFYLSPETIEKGLRESTTGTEPKDPREQRRTLGVLAGFAFGRKDYVEAARLQFEWAKSAEEAGEPAEAASAWYNLGNTMLEQGSFEHAERFYVQCCELCLEHGVDGVLPMALTNLGVALSRQARPDEAVQTLLIAYKHFKAQRHRPGQAFVFDALAGVYCAERRYDEAERAWLAAYDIYDGITSDVLVDLRTSGCADIRAKLERFCATTGRADPLARERQLTGVR